ncbi:hypothetical protein AVEN_56066-1 [Araneus ventricosus]|uniref:Endonuclease/exonuclease/phosphatase domain-containing protein n=1 Tax=Araneus ventricosus TaxID=182803 RepID=A0A4Y2NUT3_ARAVE|nr:hypothetical protein AVEN_56066-1 [Araneus ventricosus]
MDRKTTILALQETHLIPGERLNFPNYTTYITDRFTHRELETAICTCNFIDHLTKPLASRIFENTLTINLPNSPFIKISKIYRPLHGTISTQDLSNILISSNKCIAIGNPSPEPEVLATPMQIVQ